VYRLTEQRCPYVTTRYRRAKVEGGTYFFTVALADRSSDLLVRHIDRLRRAYKSVQDKYPFESVAVCV
jgi:putative transposase